VAVENLYCLRVVQGIPQQLANRQIACLILFSHGYFAFKKENVKVKVKYGFVFYRKSLTILGNQTEEISMAAMFFATHISRRKDIFRKGPHIHY
jgi:hypothetical protein